ncbi:MAG TPA: hypothetical protein VHC48_03030 [Puia sp.]|nr:hypothetical protein [Puia sp.]
MKSLSLGLITLALACLTLSSATPSRNATRPAAKKALYYWYWADTDLYVTINTTSGAIDEFENMTGYSVDTNPNGTRLANGYLTNAYPHNLWPSVILFSH